MDAEDVGKDQGVRNKDCQGGNYDIDTHNNENHQLIDRGVCAGELQERGYVTHVVIDDVAITEDQVYHTGSMRHSFHKPHNIHPNCHQEADPMGHGDLVKQGLTDGSISVISHCCQNVAFINNKEAEEKELSQALSMRDGVLLHKTHQHSGGYGRGVAEVCEGKVEEKVVHGGVQVRAEQDQDDHAQVPQHCEQVDSKK